MKKTVVVIHTTAEYYEIVCKSSDDPLQHFEEGYGELIDTNATTSDPYVINSNLK